MECLLAPKRLLVLTTSVHGILSLQQLLQAKLPMGEVHGASAPEQLLQSPGKYMAEQTGGVDGPGDLQSISSLVQPRRSVSNLDFCCPLFHLPNCLFSQLALV